MATEKQVEFYESLCEQTNMEPDENFESLSTAEASKVIDELLEIKEEMK